MRALRVVEFPTNQLQLDLSALQRAGELPQKHLQLVGPREQRLPPLFDLVIDAGHRVRESLGPDEELSARNVEGILEPLELVKPPLDAAAVSTPELRSGHPDRRAGLSLADPTQRDRGADVAGDLARVVLTLHGQQPTVQNCEVSA